MGGLGSGRRGGRTTVEACRSIDINRLRKAGVLSPGWFGSWEWKRDGERIACVQMRGGHDRIVLIYSYREHGGEWQEVEEPIRIRWVDCRYGGQRPYFQCPGVVNGIPCCRSVVKLYGASRYFCCRHCYRLSFASRNEDRWDRALRRANKIRLKLGGEPGTASAFPRRPKGMRTRTYEAQMTKVFDAEDEAEERLALMLAKLQRLDRRRAPKRHVKRTAKGRYWR